MLSRCVSRVLPAVNYAALQTPAITRSVYRMPDGKGDYEKVALHARWIWMIATDVLHIGAQGPESHAFSDYEGRPRKIRVWWIVTFIALEELSFPQLGSQARNDEKHIAEFKDQGIYLQSEESSGWWALATVGKEELFSLVGCVILESIQWTDIMRTMCHFKQ